ncbi:MAG: CoA transferase [Rhodobacteraceae bacterium]|nr:CoA transferase [Paracoccaceae bacterium]
MVKPLAGLLVVSLEQAVAAPMASRRLADAGARVIKLERPEGDFARGYDAAAAGQSSYFVWLNRGKESVVVDLARAEDRALFEAMLARADVFVQNLKPGSLARLGYPVESLLGRFERLIACSITGYGDSGPYAERKAYDLLIQAEAGLASVTGGPEAPARVGVSIVDIATGLTAYEAILEALIARGRTGRGADIRVSMFDCTAEWMTVPLLQGENGLPPRRAGLSHVSVAPYGVFDTADGVPVLISIQSDREWGVLCREVLDEPGLAADPRFATNVARVANRAATDAAVAAWFAARDHRTAIERLTAAEIAFARVNDVAGLSAHPQLRRVDVATPGGIVRMPAPGARSADVAVELGPVPALGAHTRAARREFLG